MMYSSGNWNETFHFALIALYPFQESTTTATLKGYRGIIHRF
ncbi:hypothetical protein [Candidatus Riesia pediculischaeffi]|nr:hypothetical protein [Candidatus Riesia pediculischaeffi]